MLARTSYVLVRSARAIFSTNRDAVQNALLAYISDQVDYKDITEAAALKLLDQAPYKGNAYARVVALESVAKARLAASRIGAEVEKKLQDDGWKELLATAPRRGVESFTTAAAAWKDQLARSVAFEKTFWGPSKKAMQGCWAPLRKDFIDVMKSYVWRTVMPVTSTIAFSLTNTARDSGRRRVPWHTTQGIARKNCS